MGYAAEVVLCQMITPGHRVGTKVQSEIRNQTATKATIIKMVVAIRIRQFKLVHPDKYCPPTVLMLLTLQK